MPETPTANDSNDLDGAFAAIRTRAEAAGINCESENSPVGQTFLVLDLPAGRETRRVAVLDEASAKGLLSTPFERFVYLGDYEAICSYEDGFIEVGITSAGIGLGGPLLRLRELLGEGSAEAGEGDEPPAWTVSRDDGLSLRIGRSSQVFRALLRSPGRTDRGLTLQIEGISTSQHDDALTKLETLANSFFFQIEAVLQIPLALRRRRVFRRGARARSKRRTLQEVGFPGYEYDPQPISLYWYGASAVGMPLLQFLAYYQAIEFYFPVYSEYDARRRLRNVLKDPTFDAQNDIALGRLISVMSMRRGGGFGTERDQLKATIEECVTEPELSSFITETSERQEFFKRKHPRLTSFQIRVGEGSTGLREQVAERLYDVRCRIVHAKESEDYPDAILPFSREADQLAEHDIALARFVARQVLIAASRPLSV